MNKKSFIKRYALISTLIGLFIAPGLAAYLLYSRPTLLQKYFPTQTNQGYLLTPPIQYSILGSSQKWHLVLWQPASCDAHCLKEIDTLGRIRLALGRHLYQIDQWLLLGQNTRPLEMAHQEMLSKQAIEVKKLSSVDTPLDKSLGAKPRIFLANPDNFFILAYPLDTKPDAIFHDLKHLIK